jgi:hypothetical protein
MGPNIVGKWRIGGGEHIPDFQRIVVLSLTPESLGNGIGMADFTTQRLVDAYDPIVTWMNVLTPHRDPREASLPLALPSDRAAREVLASHGFGAAFRHGTGHDVGFLAIDHTAPSRLHPGSPDILRAGMDFNVEPGATSKGSAGCATVIWWS